MPSTPKEDWQPCLWSKNHFLCELPCSLGKIKRVLQSQKRHLISYSTLLYKIMKCHQLSVYLDRGSSCLYFLSVVCPRHVQQQQHGRRAARCPWEASGILLPAHHCTFLPAAHLPKRPYHFWLHKCSDRGQQPPFPSVCYLSTHIPD